MDALPFNTQEEKRLVFQLAKQGDPAAIAFLMKEFHLEVWLQEKIDALNLLLEAGVVDEVTKPFIEMQRQRPKQLTQLDFSSRRRS
jgi:hypothetical protein